MPKYHAKLANLNSVNPPNIPRMTRPMGQGPLMGGMPPRMGMRPAGPPGPFNMPFRPGMQGPPMHGSPF